MKAADHYRAFMRACGIDTTGVHAKDTPERVARMFGEFTEGLRPMQFACTSFPRKKGRDYDQLIVLRNIPLQSLCAHHHVPFHGKAVVAYLPKHRIMGLSKIVRMVQWCSRKPSIQEDLTQEIADLLVQKLAPRAVYVLLEAEHLCVSYRGVRAANVVTVTHAMRGELRDALKSEFLALAKE